MGDFERESGGVVEAIHLVELAEVTSYLSMYVKAQERAGAKTNIVLVTYNRVGEGKLPPRTVKGGLTLTMHMGGRAYYQKQEKALDFMDKTTEELCRQIVALRYQTFFVIYGGEGDKFASAVRLIDELASLAHDLGKQEKVKFYLLTCGCNLVEKAAMTLPLYSTEKLRHLISNGQGTCGGHEELQTIADKVLAAVDGGSGSSLSTRGLIS
jgi:hypothetical protein